jgi:hypothetical protein
MVHNPVSLKRNSCQKMYAGRELRLVLQRVTDLRPVGTRAGLPWPPEVQVLGFARAASPNRHMFRQENQYGVLAGRLVGNTQPQAWIRVLVGDPNGQARCVGD